MVTWKENTGADIDAVVAALPGIVEKVRSLGLAVGA